MNYTFEGITPAQLSRAYRAVHGLTQSELADAAGVGVASLKRWELGDTPTGRCLRKWLAPMGVSVTLTQEDEA